MYVKIIGLDLTIWEGLNSGIDHLRSMPYKVKMPQVNMVLNGDVDSILDGLAEKHHMTRASMARGLLRLGMELYGQNSETVLALARAGEC